MIPRLTAAALGEKLGQPIVVEDKLGANTILAMQWVDPMAACGHPSHGISENNIRRSE